MTDSPRYVIGIEAPQRDLQNDQTCTKCGRHGRMVRLVTRAGKVVRDWQCPGKRCPDA